jgi:hypothetical protein
MEFNIAMPSLKHYGGHYPLSEAYFDIHDVSGVESTPVFR